MIKKILTAILLLPTLLYAQINTERVMTIARNALYFEDYVLSIQYFNQVINAKPYLYEPYFFRGLAKINLDDYQGAESDCDAAIQRNPFVVGAYQIRGLARIRQNKFDEAIEDYKTAYLGDANNVRDLFGNLPLNNIPRQFEINSDDCTLTVNYLDTVWNIGEDKVQRDLIYNTVAAMAAIDNLSGITYNFSGDSYSFERTQIEDIFGAPLSNLLEQEKWSNDVQDKLKDTDFVEQFYK